MTSGPIDPTEGEPTVDAPATPAPEPTADAPTPSPLDPDAPASWAVSTTASQKAERPLWKRLPLGWIVVGLFVAAGAIGGLLFNAGRSSTGEIDKAGDLTVADIRVGDCFNLQDETATQIEKVTAIPCADPHTYEMLYSGNMPSGDFPAQSAFESHVVDNCVPAFTTFVGTPYESSTLGMYWLSPTESSWRSGDHGVQCAIYDPADPTISGSLEGAKR